MKGLLLRIFVPVATVVVTLLLAELMLRLPGLEQLVDVEPALRGGPVMYEPNQVARQRFGGEIDTEIRVNSRGLRDVEFTPAMPARQVVALGDSFTEGWGVRLPETWPKQLERLLIASDSGHDHVFNAGRSGTNPKNYATVYRELFAADPSVDLVVVGVFLGNDIIEPGTPEYRVPPPQTGLQRLKFHLARHSAIYNLVRQSLRQSLTVEKLLARLGRADPRLVSLDLTNSELNRGRWQYTAEFLTDFATRVRADGKQILFVLVPAKEQVIEGYIDTVLSRTGVQRADIDLFGFRDYVVDRLRFNGVEVLDLMPELLDPATLYFRTDGHWNAEGHRVAAEAIFRYLRDSGLLESPREISALTENLQVALVAR